LTNSTLTPLRGEAPDQGAQVVQVAGGPVHAVHHDVPVAGETQQFSQPRPGSVPAGGLICKDPVQNLDVELAFLVLVQSAHPHVPDPLSSHGVSNPHPCQHEFQRHPGRTPRDQTQRTSGWGVPQPDGCLG
jgi:hypothetical protein